MTGTNHKAVISLTEKERLDFFPQPLFEQLLTLLPHHHLVDPLNISDLEWQTLLQEVRPEIIISCWKTHPLPHDHPIGGTQGLHYWCHLAGSVRKLITESQLHSGLILSNWGDSISRTIAECGLFLTISALRRANEWAFAMHQEGGWKNEQTRFYSLFERKIGIHGFGAIARQLVRLMRPFHVQIESYSPSVPDALFLEHGVKRVTTLEALFSHNEIIIELAPLTPKTQGMVTESLLRRIPAGGVFVNIGRGPVVDEAALIRVAQEGNIQLALDVFPTEPLPADSPLRGLRNVTMLPHISGPSTERRQDAGRYALLNLERYMAGEALQGVVTPEVYARTT